MKTSNTVIEELKSEIKRAYRVLGRINGEMQNERDLDDWESRGAITHEEATELRKYNAEMMKQERA